MRRLRRVGLLIGIVSLLTAELSSVQAAPTTQPAGPPGSVQRDSYIVVLRDDVADPRAIAQEHANAHAINVAFVYTSAIKGYAAFMPQARLSAIQNDPRVLYVNQDFKVEAIAAPQPPVSAQAQEIPTGVSRIGATQNSITWGSSFAVAVIDTGSGPHSDLNVVGGKNCATGRSYNDGNGHGTHVAGTIGAKNDSSGVVGVAPGVPIYSVRTLDNNGSGWWSWIICGIDWVKNNASSKGIKVANMSLGGSGTDENQRADCNYSQSLHKSICNAAKTVTFVVAAGNSEADYSGFVPATYPEVLTVTATADSDGAPGGTQWLATCRTDQEETPADFTNYANSSSGDDKDHTIAAPGVCINSTWKGGGYNTISGTSMATPHVTGAAARCIKSGACSGGPPTVIGKLLSDGLDSFADSPSSSSKYYGKLVKGGY